MIGARAYINKDYQSREMSRYDLWIAQKPPHSYSWDFTAPDEPDYPYAALTGGISPKPYGHRKFTTLHATLRQYDTYEERVTFYSLDLGPLPSPANIKIGFTPRSLVLKAPVSMTTPSGITVTLPAQGAETSEKVLANFNGNANALFIQIRTSPDTALSALPQSPLSQRHGRPVRIQLDCPKPDFMVWYKADNTFQTIAVGLPDLKTLTHLDSLTLILRQRVDLQTIPVALRVPVTRTRD